MADDQRPNPTRAVVNAGLAALFLILFVLTQVENMVLGGDYFQPWIYNSFVLGAIITGSILFWSRVVALVYRRGARSSENWRHVASYVGLVGTIAVAIGVAIILAFGTVRAARSAEVGGETYYWHPLGWNSGEVSVYRRSGVMSAHLLGTCQAPPSAAAGEFDPSTCTAGAQ